MWNLPEDVRGGIRNSFFLRRLGVSAAGFESTPIAEGARGSVKDPWVRLILHVAIVLLVAAAWFGSLELRGLFVPDEGRYAEIPREMLASGDWITPRLNDLKYFEKPPLQYWMTAFSFSLFGEDEWTARLPAALAGFLAMLMVGYTGWRLWGAHVGVLAGAVLVGSWAYFLAGQYLTLDMTLSACLTFAFCSFLLAQSEDRASRSNAWMIAAWLAAALAVLSKGLIGIVLPGITLLAYIALRRDATALRRLNPVAGGAVFLLVAVPWFVMVQLRNPEFFHFFFVHEHLQRFAESDHHRPGAWWYYIPIMIVGLLPWTPALAKEFIDWSRERRVGAGGFSAELFCVLWAGVVVLFFSAAHSKLPAYILPALPAIALVFAKRIHTRGPNSLNWSAWGGVLAGITLIGLVALLPHFHKFAALGEEAARQRPWLFAAAGLLAVSSLGALWALRSTQKLTAIAVLLAGTLGCWNLVFGYLHAMDANFSSERLIESLTGERQAYRSDAPFYMLEQFDPSVPFYLKRTLTLVNTRGELGPGIDAEPYKVIPTLELFEAIWLAQKGQAHAIMRPDTLAVLRHRNLPMVELKSDGHLVIVGRRYE
jgi:4-amino-4-deoxy-L-arabinose transferase-like glycosyltransferase